jgi:hypothetical protein
MGWDKEEPEQEKEVRQDRGPRNRVSGYRAGQGPRQGQGGLSKDNRRPEQDKRGVWNRTRVPGGNKVPDRTRRRPPGRQVSKGVRDGTKFPGKDN